MEIIEKQLESKLLERGESRKYAVQTLLPAAVTQSVSSESKDVSKDSDSSDGGASKKPNVYAHQLVRTDCKSQKLDAFFEVTSRKSVAPEIGREDNDTTENMSVSTTDTDDFMESSNAALSTETTKRKNVEPPSSSEEKKSRANVDGAGMESVMERSVSDPQTKHPDSSLPRDESSKEAHNNEEKDDESLTMGFHEPRRRPMLLRSVRELGEEIVASASPDLKTLFRDSVFVGCVSRRHALLQHSTSLYLVNFEKASAELFYQIMVADFANFGLMRLSTPAPIYDLTLLGGLKL